MENVYSIEPLEKQSFFQKLFKIQPRYNVLVEINNLLASKNLNEVKPPDVNEICLKYKANIKSPKYLAYLCGLYKTYLTECLKDKILTDSNIGELNHLRELLSLDEYETIKIHDLMCGEIYKNAYREQISDGNYNEEREALIDKLQKDLRLPDIIAQSIRNECGNSFLKKCWQKIEEANQISPDEWDLLNEMTKKLHINTITDSQYMRKIERMKLNWIIENGDLPIERVDINLKKGEQCYYSQRINWIELRAAQGHQVIDTGTIYVTNKRLIFDGDLKNTSIPYSKILLVTPYNNAVGIEKDSGRSPVLQPLDSYNSDLLAMYVSRLLEDFKAEYVNVSTAQKKRTSVNLQDLEFEISRLLEDFNDEYANVSTAPKKRSPINSQDLEFEKSATGIPSILVFDTETTGLNPREEVARSNCTQFPRIVQIAWIVFDKELKVISQQSQIVKQTKKIPQEAIRIHGITDEIAKNRGVEINTVLRDFLSDAKSCDVLVAHNIGFDLPVLKSELYRNDIDVGVIKHKRNLCTMISSVNFCAIERREWDTYKYPTLKELYENCFPDKILDEKILHNALFDVTICAKSLERLRELKIIPTI
jgi:DNA polymerase III epsilon subunit-like protein